MQSILGSKGGNMDKKQILNQNKKENAFLDEFQKEVRLKSHSFGMMFGLMTCAILLVIQALKGKDAFDILVIIWSMLFGSFLYSYLKNKEISNLVLSLFFFIFMLYYLYKFLVVGA